MKKFTVYLSREYVIQIEAQNEEDARNSTELYVSGGEDNSNELIRKKHNFQIHKITPTINETLCFED